MTFRRMRDATREEWETIERLEDELYDPADGAIALLETLRCTARRPSGERIRPFPPGGDARTAVRRA